jgi:hypothetical protein
VNSTITFDDLEEWEYTISKSDNSVRPTKDDKRGLSHMTEQVIEGIVNFSNVTQHDVYEGKDTGDYTVTITISEDDANQLSSKGVKIKDYKGAKQRKFKTQFDTLKVLDAEGNRYKGEIPYNSLVRVKYKLGKPHPVHGVSTYMQAVKVLEEAEMAEGVSDF